MLICCKTRKKIKNFHNKSSKYFYLSRVVWTCNFYDGFLLFCCNNWWVCISDSELILIGIDGGKNPTFQEKFVFTLIEGLREVNVVVWNSNTLTYDDFIGNGK